MEIEFIKKDYTEFENLDILDVFNLEGDDKTFFIKVENDAAIELNDSKELWGIDRDKLCRKVKAKLTIY